jgi:hypothetical protein
MKWLMIPLCAALLSGVGGAHATQSEYRAERGDTLSAVFGKHAQAVCDANKVAGRITNCNGIIAGKSYILPAGVRTRSVSAVASTEAGEFRWKKVGGAPLYGCGNKTEAVLNEEAWTQMGLTDEEKSELRGLVSAQPHPAYTFFKPGDRFQAVAFCKDGKVSFEKNVLADWSEKTVVLARTYILKSGKVFHWVRNCNNWVVGTPLPPAITTRTAEEEIGELVIPPRKKVVEEEEIGELVIPPKTVVAERRCLLDPKLVFGQEHEPNDNGNESHSTFVTAALYCIKRVGDGYTGWGVGLQNSWWDVRVNFGSGRAHGQSLAFGPAVERISDKGWTAEGKLLFGHMHQAFSQAQYRNEREIDFVGASVAYNDYSNRLAGKKWMPETRIYASVGIPTSVRATASNFLQPTDASELERHSVVFQAGVHQDIYDAKFATFWARVGFFSELPFSQTANLRLGISDPLRVCGVGIGFDFDLLHGGEAPGYGWWCDGVKLVEVGREGYRLDQVSDGKTAVLGNGTVMTPLDPDDETPD